MPERFAEALQWAVVEHVSVSVRAEGRKIILTQRGGARGREAAALGRSEKWRSLVCQMAGAECVECDHREV